jgi:hypothetical protein
MSATWAVFGSEGNVAQRVVQTIGASIWKRLMRGVLVFGAVLAASPARADFVVKNGRFTNVYVYPESDKFTWDQYMQKLRPGDWQNFTRASIDEFTAALMDPNWPSYFGALHQYGGINPPLFLGSYVAPKRCIDAALNDRHNFGGSPPELVLEETTIRSLANCHDLGMDPSPQVNLIFSPDLLIGEPTKFVTDAANGRDFCTKPGKHTVGYHGWGVNTPNFTVLPTASGCAPKFDRFTKTLTHEVVESLSDPGQVAHGPYGSELADQCENATEVAWNGYTVERYRSDNDNTCWPLEIPANSSKVTWVLGEGSPLTRFTGSGQTLTLPVPEKRAVTDAPVSELQLWIQTGGDNLRGGNDNADVTLTFTGGTQLTEKINQGREWGNGQTHIARLNLPTPAPRVSDLQSITIRTRFAGGVGGDKWNVDRVALVVAYPTGSTLVSPRAPVVHRWLDAWGGPLVRLTGSTRSHLEMVEPQDLGVGVTALKLIVSTGNDDLRGGNDNVDVTIEFANQPPIEIRNANKKSRWKNWTDNVVAIPLSDRSVKGGDVKSVTLTTHFGGGMGGDNWNVQRVQLLATLEAGRDGHVPFPLETGRDRHGPLLP